MLPICERFGVPVLEDAAESLGARYKGRASGSFGPLAVYSFNGNKIITTSGGGMLLSDDAALIARARQLSTQAREPVHSLFLSVPGLKIAMPATPYDAKGLLWAAHQDPNPVLVFEHRWLYNPVWARCPRSPTPCPWARPWCAARAGT